MPLPRGIICKWYDTIASIPVGFVLCDGNNGTPDLRNRFVIGAGDTHDPGDTGGSTTHFHTGTTDGHTHTLASGDIIPDISPNGNFDNDTDSKTDTFTTAVASNLPPYYALAYIMKT